MKQTRHKRQIPYDSTHEVLKRAVKIRETESGMMVARDLRGGGNGE